MRKKELALAVIERLKKEYPDSDCTLDYNEAWKLLISVRLAAQCTDARVNIIVPKLYEKFPDVNALADAPVEESNLDTYIHFVRKRLQQIGSHATIETVRGIGYCIRTLS